MVFLSYVTLIIIIILLLICLGVWGGFPVICVIIKLICVSCRLLCLNFGIYAQPKKPFLATESVIKSLQHGFFYNISILFPYQILHIRAPCWAKLLLLLLCICICVCFSIYLTHENCYSLKKSIVISSFYRASFWDFPF